MVTGALARHVHIDAAHQAVERFWVRVGLKFLQGVMVVVSLRSVD
jgi:hypothetical protein